MPGKRIQFDAETWAALDLLARDSMKDFQELADEAFRDLLKKHGRPTDLKSALRQSLEMAAAKQQPKPAHKSPERPPPKSPPSKKGRKRIEGQHEMLLPISGKGPKDDARPNGGKSKPARSS
jgi:hypothetical protein